MSSGRGVSGVSGVGAEARLRGLLAAVPAASGATDGARRWWDLVGEHPGTRGRVQDLWESSGGAGAYDAVLAGGARLHQWVPAFAGGALLADFFGVADRLGLRGGETVLDLACGPGTLTRMLADAVGPTGLVVGADLSPPMLDRAAHAVRAPQVVFARVDAMDLPLGDDTVDAVCCSLCLHLVPDLDTALEGILRVLRPGAPVALAVPSHGRGPIRALTAALARGGQVRVFESGELAAALRRHGAVRVRDRHDHLMEIVDAVAPG